MRRSLTTLLLAASLLVGCEDASNPPSPEGLGPAPNPTPALQEETPPPAATPESAASPEITTTAASEETSPSDRVASPFAFHTNPAGQMSSPGASRVDLVGSPGPAHGFTHFSQQESDPGDQPDPIRAALVYRDGTPAGDFTITLELTNGETEEITTDVGGFFTVPLLPGSRPFTSGRVTGGSNAREWQGTSSYFKTPPLVKSPSTGGFNEGPSSTYFGGFEPHFSAQIINGIAVYRLPFAPGTLRCGALNQQRGGVPYPNIDVTLELRRPDHRIAGIQHNPQWHTASVVVSGTVATYEATTDAHGRFSIPDFPLPHRDSGAHLHLFHRVPLAFEPDLISPTMSSDSFGADAVIEEEPAEGETDRRVFLFHLAEPFVLTGMVVEGDGETPVPHLPLHLDMVSLNGYPRLDDSGLSLTTDSQGRFRVDRCPGVDVSANRTLLNLDIEDPDFVWENTKTNGTILFVYDIAEADFTLTLNEADYLTIQALDAEDNPLSGVELALYYSNGAQFRSTYVPLENTDAHGITRVPRSRDQYTVFFAGKHPDTGPLISEPFRWEDTDLVLLSELRTVPLNVEVVDVEALPVRDCTLLMRVHPHSSGANSPSIYEEEQHNTSQAKFYAPATNVTFTAITPDRRVRTVELDLSREAPPDPLVIIVDEGELVTVRGEVRDIFNEPLAGATVMSDWEDRETPLSHAPWQPEYERSVQTDSQGRFEILAPAPVNRDQVKLQALADGYAPHELEQIPASPFLFLLQPKITVHGRLVDPDPVTHHHISLWFEDLGSVGSNTITDAEGLFSTTIFMLRPGRSWEDVNGSTERDIAGEMALRIRDGEQRFDRRMVTLTREPGQVIELGDVTFDDALQVQFRTVDERGTPLENARVELTSRQVFFTDAEGMTDGINLSGGSHRVTVTATGHHQFREDIELTETGTHDIVMQPVEEGSFTITVLSDTGEPLPNLDLFLSPIADPVTGHYETNVPLAEGVTNQLGVVRFENLRHHWYRLSVYRENGESRSMLNMTTSLGEIGEPAQHRDLVAQFPTGVPITVEMSGQSEIPLYCHLYHPGPDLSQHDEWTFIDSVNMGGNRTRSLFAPLGISHLNTGPSLRITQEIEVTHADQHFEIQGEQ